VVSGLSEAGEIYVTLFKVSICGMFRHQYIILSHS
jgi:hypothetical protein